MPALSVPCYGGRTFLYDNDMIDDVTGRRVTVHGGRFTLDLSEIIGPLPRPCPPPSWTVSASSLSARHQDCASQTSDPPQTKPPTEQVPPSQPSKPCMPVLMKERACVLPQGLHTIPCKQSPGSKVLVLPPSPIEPPPGATFWPPQVCDVASGFALYVNQTGSPLLHAKNTHFRLVEMEELPVTKPISCPVNLLALNNLPRPTIESRLSLIKINTSILSATQLENLHSLHRYHSNAFNEDMRDGFQDPDNPYFATFAFKDENRAPPHKVWAPQYNRKSLDLFQAKCDQLEGFDILTDQQNMAKMSV